jgi:hypothetical protein
MADAPQSLVAVREARERVIATLGVRYAEDVLDVDEYERRVERAHHAGSIAELEALLADLGLPSAETALAPVARTGVEVVDDVPARKLVFAMFGGAERRGAWTVPRTLRVVTIMGGAEIDLREARLAAGVTELKLFALMGGTHVIVPSGLRVEVDGVGVLGGFEENLDTGAPSDPNGPVLRVSGVAMMGGMEIEARLPGETAREARRRRKAERKALKASQRDELEAGDRKRLGPGAR